MRRERPLRSPKSDPQRAAYYHAEEQFRPSQTSPLRPAVARRVIAEVRKAYGLPPIALTREPFPLEHSQFGGMLEPTGRGYRIVVLDPESCDLVFILHELAHAVRLWYFDDATHGPEFVAVILWLFNDYRIAPEDAFRLVLRRFGVRHRPMTSGAPRAILLTSKRKRA